ncbi:amino acid ABC transporter permease [Actinosynnema sp. ALI-1.44]|uniref:amino acid ABC transporter permease n=1 Tax=Actinosynnema sp. ALI-1.44 TaxID=1933779 RepID=UPI00097BEDF1|nr:amino acid ABC transporter permease [Actinosynnema sp. ALI-1.44]ONI76397.1 amino acid ABC transporter permease [Actinosynnema sp. ALI-1.44]
MSTVQIVEHDRERPPAIRAVPVRRPGRWIATGLAVAVVAVIVYSVVTNPAFQWDVVGRYFTAEAVLNGLVNTLWLTAVALVGGFLLGTLLAVMRLSGSPVLAMISRLYVWFFRSTPLMVQLLFWYNISLLYPRLFGFDTRNLISGLMAAVIGLVLYEAAQAAEIVRAGILSVDPGQREAANALGLSRTRVIWRIVLPQAMRAIVPPMGNQTIGLLKGTAIVSTIAVHDLLFAVQLIYNQNYQIVPLLLVATLWYMILTTLLGIPQYYLERHYAKGTDGEMPPTPAQRLRRRFAGGAR